jgi:hypothetical protein
MLEYLHGQQFLLYSVMISMLASILEGCGFNPWSGQIKEYKIVFAISPLCMQH